MLITAVVTLLYDIAMQHSYGFIRCLEREARLFFHYSEFGGDADTMRTGGASLLLLYVMELAAQRAEFFVIGDNIMKTGNDDNWHGDDGDKTSRIFTDEMKLQVTLTL